MFPIPAAQRDEPAVRAGRLVAMLRAHAEALVEAALKLHRTRVRLAPWSSTAQILPARVIQRRCSRCGLHVVGWRGVASRVALHEHACPGGDRAGDVWFPFAERSAEVRILPALKLVVGGKARKPRHEEGDAGNAVNRAR